MLSFFTLSLATLIVMSDRDHFWDANKIAKETEISCDALPKDPSLNATHLKDKKILFVIHGFNNSAAEAMKTYRNIADHFDALKDKNGNPLYDLVIGYLWPGYQNKLDYYAAKKHARELKDKMESHLSFLSSLVAKVDVMAHSMGNRLVFEALNFSSKEGAKKLVNHFYSIAAAVDQESIENNHKYSLASKNCEDIFVFHSKQDEVLEFLYTIAECDRALGFEKIENLKQLPPNVQLIDCSTFATGHSQYFNAPNIYEFIRNKLLNQTPSITIAPNLKILANGDVEILSTDKTPALQQTGEIKKAKF